MWPKILSMFCFCLRLQGLVIRLELQMVLRDSTDLVSMVKSEGNHHMVYHFTMISYGTIWIICCIDGKIMVDPYENKSPSVYLLDSCRLILPNVGGLLIYGSNIVCSCMVKRGQLTLVSNGQWPSIWKSKTIEWDPWKPRKKHRNCYAHGNCLAPEAESGRGCLGFKQQIVSMVPVLWWDAHESLLKPKHAVVQSMHETYSYMILLACLFLSLVSKNNWGFLELRTPQKSWFIT